MWEYYLSNATFGSSGRKPRPATGSETALAQRAQIAREHLNRLEQGRFGPLRTPTPREGARRAGDGAAGSRAS